MTPTALRQPAPPATERVRWGALLVVLSGTFMTMLDFFIVNVAIPALGSDLHATSAQVQWVVAGFGLALGVGVITAGRLGDIVGRRRAFAIGMAAFTLTSLACGLAPGATELVAFRVVQGAAAAVMTPQVLAIIGATHTGRALGRAITAYGLAMGLAAVFGQVVGGLLIAWDVAGLGWRLIFLINVPAGLVALLLLRRLVPESRGDTRSQLDVGGVALVSAALLATVLPLIQGQAQGWPMWTRLCFVAAAVVLVQFVRNQRRRAARGRTPLVDPGMFAERAFSVGSLLQLVFAMGQGSFFLVLAIYLQAGRGLSALGSGLLFTVIGAGYLIASFAAPAVGARLGRQVIAVGGALMALALVALHAEVVHIATTGPLAWLLAPLFLDGVGMGLVLAPATGVVVERVSPHVAGAASGVLATAGQVGGALGVAAIGILFYRGTDLVAAFAGSTWFLVGIAATVVVLTQLLPRDRKEALQ